MSLDGNKQLHSAVLKASGAANSEQLAVINGYTLEEHTAEQVYVRTAYLAHNGIDRDKEAFDSALLKDFAATLPGKGVFVKHPGGWDGDSGPGVGRWFSARVVEMSLDEARAVLREPGLKFPPGVERAELLEAGFFIPRSEKNKDQIADIDAGIAGDVSIGFRAAQRTDIQDGDGNVMGRRLHAPGEALEGSLVWLGAQPGARIHKAADRGESNEDHDMDLQKQVDDQKTEIGKLNDQLKAAQTKATQFDALKAAVGDDLAGDLDRLKTVIANGKTYHKELVDSVVSASRVAGMIKSDDADAIAAEQKFYEGLPVDRIKKHLERIQKMAPDGGAGLEGGDPNASDASHDEGGEKDDFNPMHNKAVAG